MAGPIDVSPGPEFAAFAPVPVDSVREAARPTPGNLDAWLPGAIGAPYQRLGQVSASNAGNAEAAKQEIRKRIAQMGGNLMVDFDTRRHPVGPYTGASAFAVRVLPPMPDAAERCRRLVMPDSALARVIACREAARQDRADTTWPGALVVATLMRAEHEHGGFQERFGGGAFRSAVDADARDAADDAIRSAWKDDPRGLDAPWVGAVLDHYRVDSVRAYQVILAALNDGRRHEVARAYLRVAPDSLEGYTGLTGHACTDGRVKPDHAAALRVLATYIRRRPDDHRGWANAAIHAHGLGEAARKAGDEARGTEHHTRAMGYWERTLLLNPRYFSGWDNMAPGRLDWQHWRGRVPRQPPATTDDLPPDCEELRVR
ncbi:MAG TPA: hypothetical protein VFX39_05895 [Gemmatimonadaceae bacterium]|nr:hypothetical protein [Gemmatimonadaceae bacterium]